MRMKKVILGIIKLIIFQAAIMGSLILVDWLFMPLWLTDTIAFALLGIGSILFIVAGVFRSKAKGQNNENVQRDAEVKPRVHKTNKRKTVLVAAFTFAIVSAVLFVGVTCFHRKPVIETVPENVVEFGEKYPEAREYVQDFMELKDVDFDMDVTADMSEKKIPLFIQWDKRWGYRDYGGNYIGVAGCGPSCVAMVACGLKQDSSINPYVVGNYAAEQGLYTYGQGTSWDIMTTGAEHYGLTVYDGSVSAQYIRDNLSDDSPMICSMKPGDFTYTGHFIVLTGIDDNGLVVVNDPNSPKNSAKKWDVDTLVSQMKSVWMYRL